MQNKTRKGAVPTLLAAIMVLSLFVGIVPTTAAEQSGDYQGLTFNGVNQYIKLDSALSAPPATMEIRAKTTGVNRRQLLFGNYASGTTSSHSLEMNGSNLLRYYETRTVTPNVTFDRSSAVGLAYDTWTMITYVRDIATGELRLYIDGVYKEKWAIDFSNGIYDGVYAHMIGTDQRLSMFWQGEISEIRLWDGVRTDEQISENASKMMTEAETGLLHLWLLDENLRMDGVLRDKVAGGIDGVLVNFPIIPPIPDDIKGLTFNGVNQHIELNSALSAPPVTMEILALTTGMNKRQLLFGNYMSGSTSSHSLEINVGNRLRYWEDKTFSSGIDRPASSVFPMYEWVLITYVRDTVAGELRLYMDGEFVEKWTYNFANEYYDGIYPHLIGADQRRSMFWQGEIAEIRLWEEVRTDEQIKANVKAELTGTEAGLSHLWLLDEDLLKTGVLYDKVEGGINGILVNFPTDLSKVGLSIDAPQTLLKRGETINVNVTVTNGTEQAITDVSLNVTTPYSYLPVSVPSGAGLSIAAGESVTLNYRYIALEGGREAFRVKLEREGFEIKSATSGVSIFGPGNYRGDNHSHSTYSDGSGTISQNAAHVFDVKMLSWLYSTDHNTTNQRLDTQAMTALYAGKFINLANEEFTSSYGHALTLGIPDRLTAYGSPDALVVGSGSSLKWQEVIDMTTGPTRNGIFYMAHPAHPGLEFVNDNEATIAGLRRYTGLEVWNYNSTTAANAYQFDMWDKINSQGTGRYAGIAVTDAHVTSRMGDVYIKAFLSELSVDNINDTLKKGSYVGSNGSELRFDIDGVGIADALNIAGVSKTVNFNIHAFDPVSNLTSVQIVKNTVTGNYALSREIVFAKSFTGEKTNVYDATIEHEVMPGEFYRVEVRSEKAVYAQEAGFAYTNNIWIDSADKSNATDLRDIQYNGNGIEIMTLPAGILYLSGVEGVILDLDKLTATVANGAVLEKSYDSETRFITLKVTAEDGTVTVKDIYVSDPISYVPIGPELPDVVSAAAYAEIVSVNNVSTLVVTVTEILSNGTANMIYKTFADKGASGVYTVGAYQVFVASSGNKVVECYIVDELEVPSIVSATTASKDFVGIVETSKNSGEWVLTFKVTETHFNGDKKVVTHSVILKGNNANQDGTHTFTGGSLKGYTLVYDIKGNGSNIKEFKLTK